MGILRSRTLLLIFGVLSLAMVNGQTSNRDRLLAEMKQKIQELNLLDSAKFEQEFAKYEQSFRETCKKNGGAKAYANAVKETEKFANCSMSISTLEQGSVPSTTALDSRINYYCSKVQHFENCLNPFLNSINPCFDSKTIKDIDLFKSVTISILMYGCESNGEHIKTFINDGGIECLMTQQVPLMDCLKFSKRKEASELENCKSYKELESCVDEKLKKCNKPSITKIANHVVHLPYDKADCAKIIGSTASPTTVINSLLVITGIAMLL